VTSAVSVQLSIKYGGAVPWRHRYMSTASLNRTRSVTSSGGLAVLTAKMFVSGRPVGGHVTPGPVTFGGPAVAQK